MVERVATLKDKKKKSTEKSPVQRSSRLDTSSILLCSLSFFLLVVASQEVSGLTQVMAWVRVHSFAV